MKLKENILRTFFFIKKVHARKKTFELVVDGWSLLMKIRKIIDYYTSQKKDKMK